MFAWVQPQTVILPTYASLEAGIADVNTVPGLFVEIGSHEIFAQADLKPQSS
jgi:hypothetical protein